MMGMIQEQRRVSTWPDGAVCSALEKQVFTFVFRLSPPQKKKITLSLIFSLLLSANVPLAVFLFLQSS